MESRDGGTMARDARALSFEIDYWLAMLDDVQDVNEIADPT